MVGSRVAVTFPLGMCKAFASLSQGNDVIGFLLYGG